MPRLAELHGTFLKRLDDRTHRREVPLSDADGLLFLCPKCYAENKGAAGTHSVLCWFAGKVPDHLDPKPGRWNPSGTDLNDVTLGPSVLLTGGCGWHGFVRDGGAD